MLQQPNLFSSELPSGPADPEPQPLPKLQQPAPIWLQRLELFLRVAVRLYLGIFVLVLPWWPRFWDDNPLFHLLPPLGELRNARSSPRHRLGLRPLESLDRLS